MTPQATSFLLWTDIPDEHEAGFNEWYNREHVPDRVLGIPGFIQARRFAAIEGAPRYAALYEVTGPGVFHDEAYLAMRRTPDARSQHYIALFRNVIRFVGRPIAHAGAVPGVIEAPWVRLAAFKAPPITDAGDWQSFTAAMVRRPGIMRARVFAAQPELQEGAVSKMRGAVRESLRGPDRLPDALLMIEGATELQLADIDADLERAVSDRPGWTAVGSARMQQVLRVSPT